MTYSAAFIWPIMFRVRWHFNIVAFVLELTFDPQIHHTFHTFDYYDFELPFIKGSSCPSSFTLQCFFIQYTGAAEWAAMSERERQAELLRRRLEQKRLMREGKLEEAAKLLGEGFAADANLKKLMGQNRAK